MVTRVGRATPFVMGFRKQDFPYKEIYGKVLNYEIWNKGRVS